MVLRDRRKQNSIRNEFDFKRGSFQKPQKSENLLRHFSAFQILGNKSFPLSQIPNGWTGWKNNARLNYLTVGNNAHEINKLNAQQARKSSCKCALTRVCRKEERLAQYSISQNLFCFCLRTKKTAGGLDC